MDLKDILGDDYKVGMTLEEINEALKGKKLVDPDTLEDSVSKKTFDKTASELAKLKKELRELKETTMTAEEKLKDEQDKAIEAQQNFQKEIAKLRAKEIFVEAGLKQEEYDEILETVVTEDEDTTKTRAKNMIKLINAQKEAVEKAVKAELLKNTPKPKPGQGGGTEMDYDKLIAEARATGDMVSVSALIRQQQQELNKDK